MGCGTTIHNKVRKCTQINQKMAKLRKHISTQSMCTADGRQSSSIQQQLLGTRDPIDTSSLKSEDEQ